MMDRFRVDRCVIDGLPETHATREFAREHRGEVFMNFFNEHQRGDAKWDTDAQTVLVNRTEALDASRAAIRERKIVLPRRQPIIEEFAKHMAADAKVLDEDEDTGAKRYRYNPNLSGPLLPGVYLRLARGDGEYRLAWADGLGTGGGRGDTKAARRRGLEYAPKRDLKGSYSFPNGDRGNGYAPSGLDVGSYSVPEAACGRVFWRLCRSRRSG